MLFDVAREFLGAVLEEDVHAVLRDRLHVESEYRPPTASDELEEERAEEDWELEPIEASLSRVAPAVMRSWPRAWRSPRTAPGRSCRREFPAIVRSSGAVRKNST